ncbi:MAG: CHAD domain-containing protein, partial [Helicobacteraceae bacterium]|nr:CHAD domain-containing protein [Helicobacteraceae bacterium]
VVSYSINLKKNVEKQSQKVALSQLKKSIEEIEDNSLSMDKKIHQLRKRCKKMRGLLRIIRPQLQISGVYDAQNQYFKETAKQFSAIRDKRMLEETFKKIVLKYNLDENRYMQIVQSIESMKVQSEISVQNYFALYRAEFEENRKNIEQYRLKEKSSRALDKGIKKGYKKASKLKKKAYKTQSDKDFHAWRKWVKYHWYHMRLIKKNEECVLGPRVKVSGILADILGDEHDLSVFKRFIEDVKCEYKVEFMGYLKQEQDLLRKRAEKLSDILFCNKSPKKGLLISLLQ